MSNVINEIHSQYTCLLMPDDWLAFRQLAEYHFKIAAKLHKADLELADAPKSMLHSVKRLHIGVGFELILKAAYLKNGKCINVFNRGIEHPHKAPIHDMANMDKTILNAKETYSLSLLIQNYSATFNRLADKRFADGLRVAYLFRSKEGRIACPEQDYNDELYQLVSDAIIKLYQDAFDIELDFQIAIKRKDKGVFKVKKNKAL